MSSTINTENLYLTSVQKQTAETNKGILGKDDFLRILIAQLRNQDPLNPMQDKEFITQMAHFSSLEQMTNMSQSIQKFVELQTSQNLMQHSELIGKQVKWEKVIQLDNGLPSTEESENTVSSVKIDKGGKLLIQLDNGAWIENGQITQISKPA